MTMYKRNPSLQTRAVFSPSYTAPFVQAVVNRRQDDLPCGNRCCFSRQRKRPDGLSLKFRRSFEIHPPWLRILLAGVVCKNEIGPLLADPVATVDFFPYETSHAFSIWPAPGQTAPAVRSAHVCLELSPIPLVAGRPFFPPCG